MHLLIVTQYFWPENFRINDLVVDFIKRGFKVTVLTGYPNYPEGRIFPSFLSNKGKFSHLEGADIIRCPMIPRGKGGAKLILNYLSFAISASILGAWKLRRVHYDLVFAYQVSPATIAIPAIFLKRLRKAPLVFWILDLWPETLEALGVVKSRFLVHSIGKCMKWIYSSCDLILVQSKAFIDNLALRGIPPQKISYFPSWAEAVFTDAKPIPAAEIQPKPDAFKILFAGNIGDAQDFPTLLDTAAILKNEHIDIQWFILGSGRRANWVKEEVKKRELSDQFFMVGTFPVERMPSFYAHADALLVSLKDEPIFSLTIPGKVQSYLAFGVPLLGVLAGEGARIIEETKVGVVAPPGKPAELADTIKRLIRLSPEEKRQMGRNALELSSSQFNREKLFDNLEVMFKNLRQR